MQLYIYMGYVCNSTLVFVGKRDEAVRLLLNQNRKVLF